MSPSQFVPLREFMDGTGDVVRSQARLAKEVLAEIPDQFLSYMKSRNIKPKPALQRQASFPTAPPPGAMAAGARTSVSSNASYGVGASAMPAHPPPYGSQFAPPR